jgi:hypothetical protein
LKKTFGNLNIKGDNLKMKKIFLLLSLLVLTAGMSYAMIAHIATVASFSGDIRILHNGDLFPIANGTPLAAGDQIVFLTSRTGDWVEIIDDCLPGSPKFMIYQTTVPALTHIIYWDADVNNLSPKGDGGGKSLAIHDQEGFLPSQGPHANNPD